MRLKIRLVTLSLVSVFAAFAADARETAQLDRLADLAKLWAAVKYLHPYLAYREDIDWDKALVEAIPKAIAANDGATYAAAVAGMLAALHDPATCVLPHPAQPISADADKNRERDPRFKMTGNGVLVVFLNHYDDLIDYRGAVAKMAEIKKQIAKARAVVFDLRPVVPVNPDSRLVSMSLNFGEIASRLAAVPLTTPGERRRMHIGFAPQTYAESGAYSSALAVSDGIRIEPAEKTQTGPVIFVINGESELPPFALALQAAGRGAIVAEGDGADAAAILTRRMRLAYGVAARMDLANSFKPAKIQRRALRSGAPLREKSYADMTYPSAEYRLLGLFRFWAAIHYLYPYRDLMGEDWAAVLREFIPRMEKAASGLEYARLLEDMGTHIHDGHVSVISKVLREANGAAVLPLGVRMIEGAPVVTRLDDEAAAKAAGIEIGDILLKIDGEAALARIEEAKKHIASATPQWLGLLAANEILRGPDKSTATLVIRGRNGEEREVTLARASPRAWRGSGGRKGDIVRVLNGNIGYVDLERLTVPMVDEMFDKLKDTKGIVFDMRDYPNGTAWLIAPRLTEKNDVAWRDISTPRADDFRRGRRRRGGSRDSADLHAEAASNLGLAIQRPDCDPDRRTRRKPSGAFVSFLRGGERHEIRRQSHGGNQRGRHLPGSAGRHLHQLHGAGSAACGWPATAADRNPARRAGSAHPCRDSRRPRRGARKGVGVPQPSRAG
jgi:hypothetical protein